MSSTFDDYDVVTTSTNIVNGLNEINNSVPNIDDVQSGQTQIQVYAILMPILGLVAIIINLAVVISSGLILKKGQEPRSVYLFLGNVAMTDLITALTMIFGNFFPKSMRNHYICATQIGLIVSSTLSSVYSVGLIAIDRFLYILHGMKYQRYIYPTRARLLITFAWILGGLIGFLPLMGWYGDTDNGRVCWFIIIAPKELILLTVIVGVIPVLTVIVLYSIILYNAIKKVNQLQSLDEGCETTTNSNGLRMFKGKSTSQAEIQKPRKWYNIFKKKETTVKSPSKWKAIKVVLFTSGSFVITWFPYFIVSVIYTYCEDRNSKKCKYLSLLIASPLAILGFCNSFINPIIYAWWHKGFRSFMKNTINSLWKKHMNTEKSTSTSVSNRVSVKNTTENQPTS